MFLHLHFVTLAIKPEDIQTMKNVIEARIKSLWTYLTNLNFYRKLEMCLIDHLVIQNCDISISR